VVGKIGLWVPVSGRASLLGSLLVGRAAVPTIGSLLVGRSSVPAIGYLLVGRASVPAQVGQRR